jgi:hypothetical protein
MTIQSFTANRPARRLIAAAILAGLAVSPLARAQYSGQDAHQYGTRGQIHQQYDPHDPGQTWHGDTGQAWRDQQTWRDDTGPAWGGDRRDEPTRGRLDHRTSQQIRQTLQQAGLDHQDIRWLEQRNFSHQQVEQQVRRALVDRGFSQQYARQRAQNVAQQVNQMREGLGGFVGVERGQQTWREQQQPVLQTWPGQPWRDQDQQTWRDQQQRGLQTWPGQPWRDQAEQTWRDQQTRVQLDPGTLQQIRQTLQQAGLEQQDIRWLERQNFAYRQVEQEVRAALSDRGYGRQQAQERAQELAMLIDQIKERQFAQPVWRDRQMWRDDDPQTWRGETVQPWRGQPWREQEQRTWREPQYGQLDQAATQQIRRTLQQAGVGQRDIRWLEQRDFPSWQVELEVREALAQRGYSQQLARQRAQSLAAQIEEIKEEGVGGFTGVQRGWGQRAEQQIRQRLEQAGLEEQEIDRLERQNFPRRQIESLVEDALLDRGLSESLAQERAWQIGQEVQRLHMQHQQFQRYQQQQPYQRQQWQPYQGQQWQP